MYAAKSKKTGTLFNFTWLPNDVLVIHHREGNTSTEVNTDAYDIIETQQVTAHLIDELYELYDESGGAMYTEGSFSSYEDVEAFCKDNDLFLVDVFMYDSDEPNPPYIVCWCDSDGASYYKSFTDHESNKYSAKLYYDNLVKSRSDLYSANLCQIIESTDYTC